MSNFKLIIRFAVHTLQVGQCFIVGTINQSKVVESKLMMFELIIRKLM